MTGAPGPRQIEALFYLDEHIRLFGYPPTALEVGEALDIVPHSAHALLRKLVARGLLSRSKRARARDWTITAAGRLVLHLPRRITIAGKRYRRVELPPRAA